MSFWTMLIDLQYMAHTFLVSLVFLLGCSIKSFIPLLDRTAGNTGETEKYGKRGERDKHCRITKTSTSQKVACLVCCFIITWQVLIQTMFPHNEKKKLPSHHGKLHLLITYFIFLL